MGINVKISEECLQKLTTDRDNLLAACKDAVILFRKLADKLFASGNIGIIEDLPEHKGDKHGKGSTVDEMQQAITKAESL